MKIIGAHHHFWCVSSGNYSWLKMSDPEMLWRKPSDLPREYFPADLLASTGDLELVKSVHVQCGFNPGYSAHESKWLQSLADAPGSHRFPHAIVGYTDFSTSNVEELLSQHCQYKNVR
jgi:predicted TIM-barrel fold metal-dependent hydrolase